MAKIDHTYNDNVFINKGLFFICKKVGLLLFFIML